jgi:hypothetical protein
MSHCKNELSHFELTYFYLIILICFKSGAYAFGIPVVYMLARLKMYLQTKKIYKQLKNTKS